MTDPHPVNACTDPHLLCPVHDRHYYPHHAIHQEETPMPNPGSARWLADAKKWRADAQKWRKDGNEAKAVTCDRMAERCEAKAR